MRRLWTLLLTGLVSASLASTAQAQQGSSLYRPFNGPADIAQADRFVEELDVPGANGTFDLTHRQLEAGVVVDPKTGATEPAPITSGPASARAAGGAGLEPSFGWILGTALLGLLAGVAVRLPRAVSRLA